MKNIEYEQYAKYDNYKKWKMKHETCLMILKYALMIFKKYFWWFWSVWGQKCELCRFGHFRARSVNFFEIACFGSEV